LTTARSNVELGQLGQARAELAEAQALLTRSNSGLYQNVALDLVGAFPVARENLRALRETVGLALRLTDGANRILAVTRSLEATDGSLEVPLLGGMVPLPAVRDTQEAVQALAEGLPGPRYEPETAFLVGSVARAQDLVFAEAEGLRPRLDTVGRGLELLGSLAGATGPQRFLIAVANTAEMRGAGGMILSYGILEASNGVFTLGEFGGIDDLALEGEVDADFLTVPEDYLARWDGLQPTRLWRNTTLHPDLAFNAPIMEVMFSVKTGLLLDGVIQIDPAGLAAILAGTGPVQVEGLGQVDATNVVDLTLNRAYIDFPDRDQRQELLGDVAEATFDALVGGQFGSLRPFGEALFATAQERHIAIFLNSFQAQRIASTFGATADLPPPDAVDHAILTVQNFSKNKLDYYLDTSLSLVGTRRGGQLGSMVATVTVTNTAPADGAADYVFGPNAEGETAGLYRGVVSLYLPTGPTLVGSSGESAGLAGITSEAGRTVVGFNVDVPAGQTRTVVLDLAMAPRPAGPYELTLVPVPRVRPTVVSVDVDTGNGAAVHRDPAPLPRLEVLREGQ
ncbi:MAG: DUF4012 domain-containing protein, partial [Actinomycetota bacterium]|nr:DUF4012 domain-containing protein [Actinomycetota bacterium]